MWYNLSVKKLFAIITTLAVAATLGGTAAAYAEDADDGISAGTTAEDTVTDGELYYPEFVSELVTEADCYAVNGSTFAIAEGYTLHIYSGGSLSGYTYSGGELEDYTSSFEISDLYYDSEGTLYLFDGTDTYVYSDGAATLYDGDSSNFFNDNQTITSSDGLIFGIRDSQLRVTDMGTTVISLSDGTYSMLKQTDDVIYVIKDGSLCIIEGSTLDDITVSALTFEYADTTHGTSIAIGNSARLLQTTAESAEYVNVPAGQYVTRIDLTDLSGTYFTTIEENGVHTYILEEEMTALVLCTSGNAMIVADGDGTAYITKAVATTRSLTEEDAPFAGGQLLLEAGLYSSPYISEGTKIATLAEGATVSVLGQVTGDMLATNFCRVSYTDDSGNTVIGYVATGLLTEYEFVIPSDDELTEEWNEDYSEDNVIVTVVLIIVIVLLIIAGVAYLAYFSGANRRNKKRQKAEAKDSDDDMYGGGDYGNDYGGNYSGGNGNGNGGYGGYNGYDDYGE